MYVSMYDRFEESAFDCVVKKLINKTGMLWKRIKEKRNGKIRTKNKADTSGREISPNTGAYATKFFTLATTS